MPRLVEIPESLYTRLQALGGQLFTVPEVIARLVEGVGVGQAAPADKGTAGHTAQPPRQANLAGLAARPPRERGATVEVGGQRIHAGTVSELYEHVFRLILKNGKAEALGMLAPYRTSNQRYLFAREPKHPNGKPFFVDLKVGPYHVETHKNYQQAVKQLAGLLAKLDISFRYLG